MGAGAAAADDWDEDEEEDAVEAAAAAAVEEEEEEAPLLRQQQRRRRQEEEACLAWGYDVFEDVGLAATCTRVLCEQFLPRGRKATELRLVVGDVQKNMSVANALTGQVPPYHNFCHGADVLLTTCHFLFCCGGLAMLTEVDAFAVACAALGHDVCHPGLNNAYHVNAGLELAVRYSDIAVLEAHSAAVTSKFLRDRRVLDGLFADDVAFRRFRAVLVGSILATDMAGHAKLFGRLKTFVAAREDEEHRLEPDDRLFLCDVVVHLADLSNPAKPWDLSKQWADRVQAEFFKQGDLEKRHRFPVSPNMDRDTTPDWKLALGFSDFIVKPLFSTAAQLLTLPHALECLADNRARWVAVKTNFLKGASSAAVGGGGGGEKAQPPPTTDDDVVTTEDAADGPTTSGEEPPPTDDPSSSSSSPPSAAAAASKKKKKKKMMNKDEDTADETYDLARLRRAQLIDAAHKLPLDDDGGESKRRGTGLSEVKTARTAFSSQQLSVRRREASTNKTVKLLWKSWPWAAFVATLVVLSLTLDSLRRGFLPKAADPAVNVVLLAILCAFLLEILLGVCVDGSRYVGSFIFAANVVGAASLLGLYFQQCGWLAHEVLHHQVFTKNRKYGHYCALLWGNLAQGFSCSWWMNKHNTHHSVPNVHATGADAQNGDPDIDTMPFLAWSKPMLKLVGDSKFAGFMVKHQHLFYLPILAFARLSWLQQSVAYVLNLDETAGRAVKGATDGQLKPVPYEKTELFLLGLHYAWYFALAALHPTLVDALLFLVISNVVCGLTLAIVFGLGHNGMAVYDAANRPDYWKLQVTTTRNVTQDPFGFVHWFCGGLDYQVEHHLFPTVPRHNLAKVCDLTKEFCAHHGVRYHTAGILQGTKEVLTHLHHIANELVQDFPAL